MSSTQSPRPKPLIAGNWKMNGLKASASEFGNIVAGYGAELRGKVDLAICPPATQLVPFAVVALGSRISLGGQDCH
ncbi:MAG: triose-phosphate isomerase, partial [Rhizobiales bacterium]|nr:triose-phosphate isomerase [Hyphomicrobiales bacterium]